MKIQSQRKKQNKCLRNTVVNKMLVWFHSFPEEPEVIIESQLFEQINVSAFSVVNEDQRAKKLFSGLFNEFIDFVSQDNLYTDVEIILPAKEVLLTRVSIPSKSKKRIFQALPFLLDENLIKKIDGQHFSLGHIASDQCNIAIVTNYIIDIIYQQFKALSLPVSKISSEIFQLPWYPDKWSFGFLRDSVLIRTGAQSGLAINVHNMDFAFRLLLNNAMPDDTSQSDGSEAKDNQPDTKTGIPDSIIIYALENAENIEKIATIANEYLIETEVVKGSLLNFAVSDTALQATKDTENNGINLLQGKYYASDFKPVKIPFVKSLAVIFSLWFFSQVFFMAYQWTSQKNELHKLDLQLEAIYFKTFPESKRLIDVRSQAESQLKQLKRKSVSNSSFFSLLAIVGEEIRRNRDIKINSLRYNNGVLQLDIVSKGFIFNKLKTVLQNKHNLMIEEKSSSRIDGEVHSVLNFKTKNF